MEHVQTAVMAVDADGRVGVYNEAAAFVLGVDVQEVVGRDLESLAAAHPALSALATALLAAQRSGRGVKRRQAEATTPAGKRTLGYTASVLDDDAAAVFFADITDALVAERSAAEAQRFAEVGQIAGAMAHELKSPLVIVELYANLLQRELPGTGKAAEQLSVIKDQTRLGLERIRSIMRSINPGASRMEGTGLTELAPLVRSVVADLRLRNEGSVIALNISPCDPRVALPEIDLRSVVNNLVVNALEVTGGKGPVDVRLRCDSKSVHLRVADKGPGLPEGDVFAAFFTTKSGGTGLGLWLVHRLVVEAGGVISARNRRGGGAVFDVELPLPHREWLNGSELLVVEDDGPLRASSVAALEACGAGVTAVDGGSNVPIRAHNWECAILDYHLPDQTTGIEVAAHLPAGTPVLLVSSDPAAGAALANVRERRAWYLHKPFEVETYLDLVSLLVGPS